MEGSMIEILKMVFSIGGSLVVGQIEKASMQNNQKKQLSKLQADTKNYVDNSMQELYEKLENKFSSDIRNLIIVSRFLIIGFAVILALLIVLIVLLIMK